jgi:hypothetical protein
MNVSMENSVVFIYPEDGWSRFLQKVYDLTCYTTSYPRNQQSSLEKQHRQDTMKKTTCASFHMGINL